MVGLNKGERRYTITNLGKLVLNLARQIEEKSIVESGKMYVRTSNQTIEEFNPHKIIQSLVREANMSLEQATKITEEVENKIYKLSCFLFPDLGEEGVARGLLLELAGLVTVVWPDPDLLRPGVVVVGREHRRRRTDAKSISPTEKSAGALARAAKFTPST